MPNGSLHYLHYSGGPWEPYDENCVLRTISNDDGETNEHYSPRMVCYPDGFVDVDKKLIYITYEDGTRDFLIKVPFADFL